MSWTETTTTQIQNRKYGAYQSSGGPDEPGEHQPDPGDDRPPAQPAPEHPGAEHDPAAGHREAAHRHPGVGEAEVSDVEGVAGQSRLDVRPRGRRPPPSWRRAAGSPAAARRRPARPTDRHGGLPSARASSSDSPTTNQTRPMAATRQNRRSPACAQPTLALTRKAWACSAVAVNGGSPRVEMAMIGREDQHQRRQADDARGAGQPRPGIDRAGRRRSEPRSRVSSVMIELLGAARPPRSRRTMGVRENTRSGEQQDVQRQPQPADHAEAVAEPGHAAGRRCRAGRTRPRRAPAR